MSDHAITIAKSRHDLAREANHESGAILELLKSKLTGLDVSIEDVLLMRGLAQRLDILSDVIFDTVIHDDPIDEETLAKKIGLQI